MYLDNCVAVVVPAHDEAAHVREVLDSLPPLVDRAYVVDDASTDDTWAEIRGAVRDRPSGRTVSEPPAEGPSTAASDGGVTAAAPGEDLPAELQVRVPEGTDDPPVVAVRHRENRGRGGAVKTGYRLALADGMDVVAVMDGDGQMDPDELERIVHAVATGRADYAKGNRLDGPEYWADMSRWRLFGNVLLTGMTRVASGYWGLRDPQNGYTAISRSTLASLPLEELYDDYGFLNDLLVELNLLDARVADVPIEAVYGDEESGIRYRDFVPNTSILLATNFCRRLFVEGVRNRRPWLPGTYAAAGGAWCVVLVGLLATVCAGCVGLTAGGTSGALPPASSLLVAGLLVTAVAVAVDHRQNAPLGRRTKPVVDAS